MTTHFFSTKRWKWFFAFYVVRLALYVCLKNICDGVGGRVSTEVTFWHSAEYGSDFRLNSGEIPRNSAEFRRNWAEITSEVKKFRGIPCRRNSVDTLVGGQNESNGTHLDPPLFGWTISLKTTSPPQFNSSCFITSDQHLKGTVSTVSWDLNIYRRSNILKQCFLCMYALPALCTSMQFLVQNHLGRDFQNLAVIS